MILALAVTAGAQAKKAKSAKPKPKTAAAAVPANDEMTLGLKEALSNGVTHAVVELGRKGGYYNNPLVKIPLPEQSRAAVKTLRSLAQDDLVDDFVVSMNRVAEQAVAEAKLVFTDAIRQMTVKDAKSIVAGPKNAATAYFRSTSEEKLRAKFLPIVKTSIAETGVVTQYEILMEKGGGSAGQKDSDLDEYITQKALDGLFLLIAAEEKRIREDPAARTTTILQKVFGSGLK